MSDPDHRGADAGSSSEPVTTVVERRVKAGRVADYEDWLARLLADAQHLDGYLGADVHRPAPDDPAPTFTSVFRFASLHDLRAFEASELRRRYLDEVIDLVEADAIWSSHTGLEFWFSPPPGTVVPQPVRWRMALLLGIVVYVLVLVFGQLAAAVLPDLAVPIRLALVIAVEITLMTYVLLPFLTRRLARWIYPTKTARHAKS